MPRDIQFQAVFFDELRLKLPKYDPKQTLMMHGHDNTVMFSSISNATITSSQISMLLENMIATSYVLEREGSNKNYPPTTHALYKKSIMTSNYSTLFVGSAMYGSKRVKLCTCLIANMTATTIIKNTLESQLRLRRLYCPSCNILHVNRRSVRVLHIIVNDNNHDKFALHTNHPRRRPIIVQLFAS